MYRNAEVVTLDFAHNTSLRWIDDMVLFLSPSARKGTHMGKGTKKAKRKHYYVKLYWCRHVINKSRLLINLLWISCSHNIIFSPRHCQGCFRRPQSRLATSHPLARPAACCIHHI